MEVTTKLGDVTVSTIFNNTVMPALSLLMDRVIVDLDSEVHAAFRRFVTREQPTGYARSAGKFIDALPFAVQFRIRCVYAVRESTVSVGPIKLIHWA